MKAGKHKGILYFIALVILATLCIQVYWNYKNYQVSKQQLINDVQTSLDNAVDGYYTKLATHDVFGRPKVGRDWNINLNSRKTPLQLEDSMQIIFSDSLQEFSFESRSESSLPHALNIMRSQFKDSINGVLIINDSTRVITDLDSTNAFYDVFKIKKPIETLSTKIMISISEDELSLPKIDSLISTELARKNTAISYGLTYAIANRKVDSLRPSLIDKATLMTTSVSPYFFYNNDLKIHYSNITFAILKKNSIGILLSFLLVSSVIFCLLYLLQIINRQKQLAEIKNDLISNITHEFKTPISTIGVAMEGILNFSSEKEHEKNLRYAKISSDQVEKLNVMVEKLLETATLDSEKLQLKLEPTNLVTMLEKVTYKESFSIGEKSIAFSASEDTIPYSVDLFHFENALNNMVDNAIKYGGASISVAIKKDSNSVYITITDSGNSLTELQKKQLFEKFYRVPKGNTHDVKGFGIGLYYTKKIIEKHGGSIGVHSKPSTSFEIILPNG